MRPSSMETVGWAITDGKAITFQAPTKEACEEELRRNWNMYAPAKIIPVGPPITQEEYEEEMKKKKKKTKPNP